MAREMGVGVADAFDKVEKLGGGDLSVYFRTGCILAKKARGTAVVETIKHTYPDRLGKVILRRAVAR